MTQQQKILIIDAETYWRSYLVAALQAAEYEVVMCENDECALRELDEDGFDLVITDAELNALIEKLALEYVDKRMVITTNMPTVDESIKAYRRGALDYISKALDQDKLLDAVKAALSKPPVARRILA